MTGSKGSTAVKRNTKSHTSAKNRTAGPRSTKSRTPAPKKKTSSGSRTGKAARVSYGSGKTKKSGSGTACAGKKQTDTSAEFRWMNEVILFVLLAFSVVLFISGFGHGGIVGDALRRFFFGTFGVFAYIMPFFVFFGGAFIISNAGVRGQLRTRLMVKIAAVILLLLFLCMFAYLIADARHPVSLSRVFHESAVSQQGGGIAGGLLGSALKKAFGLAGAFAIDIIMMALCVVLLTEKAVFALLRRKSHEAAAHTRKRMELYHQKRQVEAAAGVRRVSWNKRRRMDRKVKGVSSNTLVGPDPGADSSGSGMKFLRRPGRFTEQTSDLPETAAAAGRTAKAAPHDETEKEKMPEKPIVHISTMEDAMDRTQKVSDRPENVKADSAVPRKPEQKVSDAASEGKTSRTPKMKKEKVSAADNQKVSDEISKNESEPVKEYVYPVPSLLHQGDPKETGDSRKHLEEMSERLQMTLDNFGVDARVTNVTCGPSVTRYEVHPEMGVKVSKIVNLSDDIKLNLAVPDVRIEAPIPGKSAVGIEVPNQKNVTVSFRELVESREFEKSRSHKLSFCVGKDIAGKIIVADIAKMPHVLIAGATGSGKSVCINTIIMSILYHASPDEVRMIMIDPKVVELSAYNGIPHLLLPVVTDPKKAAGALHWAVSEMQDRYQKFAKYHVRDIRSYNKKVQEATGDENSDSEISIMPQILIIVDELADLMMAAPGDVEWAICRLAQLARAAGIHLVIATQRPSVNVITGLIKANMPSRIAFAVTSGVDSRTILDMNGAEKLLGKGDMLFYPQDYKKPLRVQGAFVSDEEVGDVVSYIIEKNGDTGYNPEIEKQVQNAAQSAEGSQKFTSSSDERDVHFEEAGKFLIEKEKGSIGSLQRMFKVGFNRAARIMDQLEEAGVVGSEEGTKPRKVLMTEEEFEAFLQKEKQE